ncbi:helix-turn-helix transcriptional regulator [Vibrio sp. La 4.2.2]|uniref:AraC family transcriptional regulator n=1 Tax=Vibrio sp. La 4.2.2 TaxID=2998830 RepID=UPI0022CE05C7|nr:helix-turn-helix domain-containing protein [Vibrio sp. La 4.2.2]MDA0108837.1 helix-turn-helix transcriptional regulator [Vibrio sp. La 4.2.2]
MKDKINLVTLPKGHPCQVVDCRMESEEVFLEPHRHDYFEVIWCLDDSGSQRIDFVDYLSVKGRFFTIAPGQVHESNSLGSNVKMLIFSTDFFENRYRHQLMFDAIFSAHQNQHPYIDTQGRGATQLDAVFDLLLEEYQREDTDWDLIESLLTCFLRYLVRFSVDKTEAITVRDERISQVITLIETHYQSERNVAFYADKLSITSKRLNELSKAHLGKTITKLLHDRVLLEANRELIFSTKTVKAIALQLGFEDPAYFGRFYRTNMGESPAEFRRRTSK